MDERFNDPAFTEHLRLDETGFWLLDGKVVVPGDPRTKARVLAAYHDSPMCGHGGVAKTVELLSRDLWWPSLRADVAEYVRRCEACQRNKTSTQRGAGLLQPLEVPERRWQSVSVDLVVKLPTTPRGYDSIVVYVDRLTKMAHLVPTTESLTAHQFADLTMHNVVRLHGMPEEMVSDRGPQFNNLFWGSVCDLLGIKRAMSSAYHPQSDGQTERTIRTLTEMLRSYVRPDQTDWDRWLPWVEFAYNNAWHESVQSTPFYLNYGEHPRLQDTQRLPLKVPRAHEFVEGIQNAVREAKRCLYATQQRMRARVDPHRREAAYSPGDQVLLSTKNIRNTGDGTVRKLMPKWMGPFTVVEMVGPVAVRLRLPEQWRRMHDVFHVHLVKRYLPREQRVSGPGITPPPPLQWLEGEPLYEVESLLNHREVKRGRRRDLEFLVHWKGYPSEHDSWEPRSNLLTCNQLIRDYKSANGLPLGACDHNGGHAAA